MATIGGSNIVRSGLVLELDAANARSYVSGSTVWRDVSGTNISGSLTNGPTFNSANGGSIVFNGSNQYVTSLPSLTSTFITSSFSVDIILSLSFTDSLLILFGKNLFLQIKNTSLFCRPDAGGKLI